VDKHEGSAKVKAPDRALGEKGVWEWAEKKGGHTKMENKIVYEEGL